MKQICLMLSGAVLAALLIACGATTAQPPTSTSRLEYTQDNSALPKATSQNCQTASATLLPSEDVQNIQISIGDKAFVATLEQNEAANSFVQLLQKADLVLQMSDYSGFEKVGSLQLSLPESNSQITAQAGDIMLYNGNQICIFYGSNSWSYTSLAKIDDKAGWAQALGDSEVTVIFSIV